MKQLFKIIFIFTVLQACSLKYGFTPTTPMPDSIKTISIDFFENNSTLGPSTVGQTFTENLRDLFQSQTRLELVTTNGDLAYEGAITNYVIQPIAIQGNQTAAQNRLTITVKVNFVNQVQENKNFEQSFTRFADFSSSQDLSSVEDALIKEIFDQLTQDIYNKTLGDW